MKYTLIIALLFTAKASAQDTTNLHSAGIALSNATTCRIVSGAAAILAVPAYINKDYRPIGVALGIGSLILYIASVHWEYQASKALRFTGTGVIIRF